MNGASQCDVGTCTPSQQTQPHAPSSQSDHGHLGDASQPVLPPWYRFSAPVNILPPSQQQGHAPVNTPPGSSPWGSTTSHSSCQNPTTGAPGCDNRAYAAVIPPYRSMTPGGAGSVSHGNRAQGSRPERGAWSGDHPSPGRRTWGRGYGGFGIGSGRPIDSRYQRGRGPSPTHRAPTPPVWIKQGSALMPRPGSVEAATHAAAVAKYKQQQQQQQQQQQSQPLQEVQPVEGPATALKPRHQLDVTEEICPPRVVYILRGLPGSGKSTRAATIATEAAAAAAATAPAVKAVAIHSTDSFFIDPATGVYSFNPELLPVYHQRNLDAFCTSLFEGVGTVIVDNTNLQPWQFEKYVLAAWAAGYSVKEEVVGEFTQQALQLYAERNVHGVSLEKLEVMLEQWLRQ